MIHFSGAPVNILPPRGLEDLDEFKLNVFRQDICHNPYELLRQFIKNETIPFDDDV